MAIKLNAVSWLTWSRQSQSLDPSIESTTEFLGRHKGLQITRSGCVVPATSIKNPRIVPHSRYFRVTEEQRDAFNFSNDADTMLKMNSPVPFAKRDIRLEGSFVPNGNYWRKLEKLYFNPDNIDYGEDGVRARVCRVKLYRDKEFTTCVIVSSDLCNVVCKEWTFTVVPLYGDTFQWSEMTQVDRRNVIIQSDLCVDTELMDKQLRHELFMYSE